LKRSPWRLLPRRAIAGFGRICPPRQEMAIPVFAAAKKIIK
jgi:hypothetical protein